MIGGPVPVERGHEAIRLSSGRRNDGKRGLGDHVTLIGVGEAVSAVLFLNPRTHSLGLLLLFAYMGGAIVTHMQHDESYVGQSIILVVIWVTGFLRHHQVLQSFFPARRTEADKPATEQSLTEF